MALYRAGSGRSHFYIGARESEEKEAQIFQPVVTC